MNQSDLPQLHFLCFGVGAIGTYIGGSLNAAGQKVTYIEKPEVAVGVRENGLHLDLGKNKFNIPNPDIALSIKEALQGNKFDLAVLSVKSYDTVNVIADLTPFKDNLPPFLCFQNGIENESKLKDFLGSGRVITGTVTSAIGRKNAGDIVLEKLRGVGIAADHPLSKNLQLILNTANLNAHLYKNAASMKWSKMLTNLMANASSAILDMSPAEIFANQDLFRMEIQQYREALKVMDAYKIPVTDLPGTPVVALSWVICNMSPVLSQPLLSRALGSGRGAKMPSFHIDLHSGRRVSEVDYLNGAVVRFGKEKGISTPVNEILNRTLLALTSGELPRDTFAKNPAKLLSLIPNH